MVEGSIVTVKKEPKYERGNTEKLAMECPTKAK
jgi:hypothetical protein